jgi:hypothetical protein
MPISENDISILIPTYRYRDKVVRAVESALASSAGEIIVTDDCGRDGTIERLAAYTDPRLKVLENERNLGLWENHLHALSLATKPWIKFIQADDYLLPGGLAKYAAGAGEGVTVVWSAPIVKDDETGRTWHFHSLSVARRLMPAQMLDALLHGGWILGSPSHMMLRADAIERDPAAWCTRISADLVVGSIAAARGDTVLLPHGAIGQGAHALQDVMTQGFCLALERKVGSFAYLRRRPEPGLRRLANLWAVLSLPAHFYLMVAGLVQGPQRLAVLRGGLMLPAGLSAADWRQALAEWRRLYSARRMQRVGAGLVDLDLVTRAVRAGQITPMELG